MGNPFVDAHFQHLRVDQDHPHLIGRGLVQQRQNHRIDADRFARAGGTGHQQVRHLGQIGADRLAADILAQAHGQHRSGIGIDFGAEDFRQPHGLAARVRQFQRHIVLAGDGLDHADRHQRQRTRQILGQTDDLAALHAGGRLDLVAGHDRAGVGGHHADFDAEILEFLLDQARGVFEGVGGHAFLHLRGRIEQRKRRQRAVRQFEEQLRLLFLLRAFRLRHRDHGLHDQHGFVLLEAGADLFHLAFAAYRGFLAQFSIASCFMAPI